MITKKIKIIFTCVAAVFIIVFGILCITINAKNNKIKELKKGAVDQTELVLKAQARADSLAKLECVTISNTIVVNQKGLINTTAATQISKTVATYTREEILDAIDSLNKVKK